MSNAALHHRRGSGCEYCKAREKRIAELTEKYNAMLARCEEEPPVPDKHEDDFYSGYSFAMWRVKGEE